MWYMLGRCFEILLLQIVYKVHLSYIFRVCGWGEEVACFLRSLFFF